MPWRSTLTLTHYGRKTGKPYRVKLWYVPMGEEVWVGSLDASRAWVRNLRACGRAELDMGEGPRAVTCRGIESCAHRERFASAIQARHPIMSRILGYFVRGERCGFRLCFETGEDGQSAGRTQRVERGETGNRRKSGRRRRSSGRGRRRGR